MDKFTYSIIYVMPKGTRVGLYSTMTEQEMLAEVNNLLRRDFRIEEVLRDNVSIKLTLHKYIDA